MIMSRRTARSMVALVASLALASCGPGFVSADSTDDGDASDDGTGADSTADVPADGTDPPADGVDAPDAGDAADGEDGAEIPAVCGDGVVSGGEECDDDAPGTCTTGCGSEGTEECVDCVLVSCLPPEETCNDSDDDCDGAVDEDLEGCRCTTDDPLDHEECNGIDDDCDGAIDEDLDDCGCTGGAAPTDEMCNGIDDDCDGAVDEENHFVTPPGTCLGFGAACDPTRMECSSEMCVGDDFEHYCSEECDPASPDPPCTAPEYRCWDDPDPTGTDYCRRNHDPCDHEDCPPGETCTIQIADDGVTLVTECRPALGGGALGDGCAADDECENGICISGTFCSQVCRDAVDCGAGWECIMTRHWDSGTLQYVPNCQEPCGDDADCTRGTLTACQPGAAAPSPYTGTGYCSYLYTGSDRNPTGGDCDHGGTPPVFCEHAICTEGGTGVCTEPCDDDGDCGIFGWTCEPTTITFAAPIGSIPMDVCDPP